MNELVSVVIPIYNVEKYIDRCILSVVNQTYKNLEILLIDDGSPDNCPIICDEWAKKDSRIRVIHKENGGLGMARNTGIENANGKYIFFFDSDDFVELSTVEKCVRSAEQENSDVVVFGYYTYSETGEKNPVSVNTKRNVYTGEEILVELLPEFLMETSGICVSAWSKMFNLDLLKKNNMLFKSEREIISEDTYFIIQLSQKISAVSVVFENLYYYYKNNNSLSTTYKPDRQIKNDIFLEKSIEYIKENNYPPIVEKAVTACYHGYTIGAIKQILAANIEKSLKKKELLKIFRNSFLRNTLKSDIIVLEKKSLKLFWYALKFKQYWVCRLLLLYRLKVKK